MKEERENTYHLKFIVFSYDSDEEQFFFDPVLAADEQHARKFIAHVRGDYAHICEVWPLHELRTVLNEIDEGSDQPRIDFMRALVEESYDRLLHFDRR